ncbi:MAG: ORF6N domain-containing protein [Spirochaetia bacterium]|nr:ORF6N domain-containing protein [Spirochaetia bacterium]
MSQETLCGRLNVSSDTKQFIPLETDAIRTKIFLIRGQQVMLDKVIAALYEVKPIRLREQLGRNIERFPEDFMFQLTEAEVRLHGNRKMRYFSRKHLGGLVLMLSPSMVLRGRSSVFKFEAAEIHVKTCVLCGNA